MSDPRQLAASGASRRLSSRFWLLGQPIRCYLGFHGWRTRNVVARWRTGAFEPGPPWEVYEECRRCGEERSYMEWNRRRAMRLQQIVRPT